MCLLQKSSMSGDGCCMHSVKGEAEVQTSGDGLQQRDSGAIICAGRTKPSYAPNSEDILTNASVGELHSHVIYMIRQSLNG